MSDYLQGTADRNDDDRLPWLEPADGDEATTGVSPGKLAALVVAALIAIGIVIAGVWLLRQQNKAPIADPTLIAAPEGDYKVRPETPGGMKVEGKGDSAFATSEGAEANGRIDPRAGPELPIAGSKGKPTPAKPNKATATPNVTLGKPAGLLTAKPPLAASGSSGVQMVQLGAFGSEAKANAAWASLIGRFAFLAPLSKQIVVADVGGAKIYRLRAGAGGEAGAVCAKLSAANENCMMVR